jgi:hypothetical protein
MQLLMAVILSIGLLSTEQAFAQYGGATSAGVTGNIIDSQGAVIQGASVTITSLQTGSVREVTSDDAGDFLINQLSPGTYRVTAQANGFATQTSTLEVFVGTTTVLNLSLSLGATNDVVEVKGSEILDYNKTEGSISNNRQRIDSLPINRRNFTDFALTAPRVTQDRGAQGILANTGISFNGQSPRFNNITIDGVDNIDLTSGSPLTVFSQDAVQEFQVLSDNYAAEYGRALGGIINIVTPSGGNNFHGRLFFLNRNEDLSARNAFSPINPEFRQYQFGATLGGPIKKDRAFFFSSFERLTLRQNNIVTIRDASVAAARRQGFVLNNGPSPFGINTSTFLLRTDWRVNANDNLYIRYNLGETTNGAVEAFGGLIGSTSTAEQRLSDDNGVINNVYTNAGLRLVNETRLAYRQRAQKVDPLVDGPQAQVTAPEGTILFGRFTFGPQPRVVRDLELANNLTLDRGNHIIKLGVDFRNIRSTGAIPFFPNGMSIFLPINFAATTGIPTAPILSGLQAFDPTLRTPEQRAFLTVLSTLLPRQTPGFPILPLADLGLPSVSIQGFGNPSTQSETNAFAAFLQDDLKVTKNLVLKLGLRYDITRVSDLPKNNGNIAPRIGISYHPLSRLNLRASYGLFFSSQIFAAPVVADLFGAGKIRIPVLFFPLSIIPFSQPGKSFPQSEFIPPGIPFIPQFSQTRAIDQNFRASYTQQANFGGDYFFNQQTTVSLTYTYVRGLRLFVQRQINPIIRPGANPAVSALTGRPDPTRGDVGQFETSGDSYYHGLTVSLTRQFNRRVGLLTSYTFSKAIDNTIDLAATPVDQALTPLALGSNRGLSLQDIRSRFLLSGTWQLSYTNNPVLRDFELSSIVNLESGRPFNLITGNLMQVPVVGRNAGLAPGFASVDLRLTRVINFKETYRLQLFAEAFNLFNRVNISLLDRTFTPDAQGRFNLPPRDGGRFIATPNRFRGTFAPRQFQVGFRFTF